MSTTPEQKYYITIEPGQRHRVVDEAETVLGELGGLSRIAGSEKLLREVVGDGLWVAVTAPWLRDHLGRHIRFTKNGRPVDVPHWLTATLLARADALPIPTTTVEKQSPYFSLWND